MSERPETGPLTFGKDWAGMFIRGDSSLGYSIALKKLMTGETDPIFVIAPVMELLGLLAGTDERVITKGPQRLKPFAECVASEEATEPEEKATKAPKKMTEAHRKIVADSAAKLIELISDKAKEIGEIDELREVKAQDDAIIDSLVESNKKLVELLNSLSVLYGDHMKQNMASHLAINPEPGSDYVNHVFETVHDLAESRENNLAAFNELERSCGYPRVKEP